MDNVYDMCVHETICLDNGWKVLCVPGGWIYTILRLDSGQMNSIFVPLDEELKY